MNNALWGVKWRRNDWRVGWLTLVLLLTGGAWGAGPLEKQLDETARIDLTNVTLQQALEQIQKLTGIVFDAESARGAMDILPYGVETQISVKLEGITWRAGLTEMLKPLALKYEVGRDRVYIVGTKELERQPKRLTLEELKAVAALQHCTVTDQDKDLLRQLRQATGIRFVLVIDQVRGRKFDDDIVERILSGDKQRAGEVLDQYVRRDGRDGRKGREMSWYVAGAETETGKDQEMDIVILPERDLAEVKLQRRVTKEYKSEKIQRILEELAAAAGMSVEFEPGCIGLLDEATRSGSSLVVRGGTVRSALEAMEGLTGLAYQIVDVERLRISASESLKQAAGSRPAGPPSGSNPLAATLKVQIPGTDLETTIFIREQALQEAGVLEQFQLLRQAQMEAFIHYLRTYNPPAEKGKEKK